MAITDPAVKEGGTCAVLQVTVTAVITDTSSCIDNRMAAALNTINGKMPIAPSTPGADMVSLCKVTYSGGGQATGEAPEDTRVYAHGSPVTLPDPGNLRMERAAFRAWSGTVSGDTNEYQSGETFAIMHDVDFVAVWEALPAAANIAVRMKILPNG